MFFEKIMQQRTAKKSKTSEKSGQKEILLDNLKFVQIYPTTPAGHDGTGTEKELHRGSTKKPALA